jgi:hypothetical protein
MPYMPVDCYPWAMFNYKPINIREVENEAYLCHWELPLGPSPWPNLSVDQREEVEGAR